MSYNLFQCTYGKILPCKLIRKQNALWSAFPEPVFRKKCKVSFRQNGITVHPVLGIPDMNLHVCAGNIIIMKMNHLRDTHSGRIHCGEHGFIFQVIRSIKKPVNFISRKYCWEFVLYYHAWNSDIIPQNVKYIPIEKTDG